MCVCLVLYDSFATPPGSFVHEISQARILEKVAISFSRGIFLTQRLNPCILCLLHSQVNSISLAPPAKPQISLRYLLVLGHFMYYKQFVNFWSVGTQLVNFFQLCIITVDKYFNMTG